MAKKIARQLNADIEEIKPKVKAHMLLIFFSGIGIQPFENDPGQYEKVILCGPVWMGKLIAPLRSFLKKYKAKVNKLYFVCCCGSSDEMKFEKFGHGHVFNNINEIMGEKCIHCEAMPIGLVLPEDKQKDSDAIMNTRLTDINFDGKIKERFENLLLKIGESFS